MANLGAPFVLVVEDDRDTRANLRDILELDDYRVEEAATAAEALRRRDWSGYLAILLDRRLPDGTAADVLPRLRRLRAESAVIVVTGHGDVDGAIDAIRQGAIDYLLKPIDPEVLRTGSGGSRSIAGWRSRVANRSGSRASRCSTRSTRTSPCWTIRGRSWPSTGRGVTSPATNGAAVADVSEGADYFATCARAAGEDGETAWAFAAGIHDVLAGRRGSFELEYRAMPPNAAGGSSGA